MKNALFVMPPALGHLNAVSPISQYLKEQGYRVVYMGTSGISEYVLNQGDDLFISNTIPVGLNLDIEIKKLLNGNISYLNILSDKINGKGVNDRRHDLEKVFDLVSPELIFIDSYLSTDFILIYNLAKQRGASIFFAQTMLSCDEDKIHSPAYKLSRIQNILHKFQQKSFRKLDLIYQKFKYVGYDDSSTVYRLFNDAKIPQKYSVIGKNFFHWVFQGIPELILAPEELEFTTSKRENQYYLGIPTRVNKLETLNEEVLQYIQSCKKDLKGLVYISFGSQYTNKLEYITSFLSKLDAILAEINVKAIFSFGGKEFTFDRNFKNILVVSFISNNLILQECQLFISHGGLNSIKDAILEETPPIVYPLEGDQINNAQKVSFHQIGLNGDLTKDADSDIKKKILSILYQDEYKRNIILLKNKILNKYDYKSILTQVINGHQAI